MTKKFQKFLSIAAFVGAAVLLLQTSPGAAQNTCKGLSQNRCGGSSSCTWVKGYSGKSGKAVSAYCRKKPSKSSAKTSGKSKVERAKTRKAAKKRASSGKDAKVKTQTGKKAKSAKRKSVKSKTLPTKARKADRKAKAIKGKATKKVSKGSKR